MKDASQTQVPGRRWHDSEMAVQERSMLGEARRPGESFRPLNSVSAILQSLSSWDPTLS